MLKTTIVVLVAAFAVIACGTNPLPAGAVCTQTSDCESSLMCLDVAQFSGSACSVVGKACSIVCPGGVADTTCNTLGSNFLCFAGCGSQSSCEATGAP